jgi:hypothetical protein
MVTPWDKGVYFYQAIQWSKSWGYECSTCGEPAEWEIQYTGEGTWDERYLCDEHYKEEFKK